MMKAMFRMFVVFLVVAGGFVLFVPGAGFGRDLVAKHGVDFDHTMYIGGPLHDIDSFEYVNGSTVRVNSVLPHYLANGDRVLVHANNYTGSYVVANKTDLSFEIAAAWVKNESDAAWSHPVDLTGSSAEAKVWSDPEGAVELLDLAPTVEDAPGAQIAVTLPASQVDLAPISANIWSLIIVFPDGSRDDMITGNFFIKGKGSRSRTGTYSVVSISDSSTVVTVVGGRGPAGSGTDDQLAAEVPADTTNFNNKLSPADNTVQKALDTLDDQASGGTVDSVNGYTGVVVLDADDIGDGATNKAYTAAEQAKLAGVEAGATADQTGSEIKTAYEAEANTNAFTDAEKSKLGGVAAGAEVNVNPNWSAVSGDGQILNKPTIPSQAEAEAGTATTERVWTAQRVAQAIAALAPGGVDEIVYQADCSGITNGFCIETGDGGLFYYNGSAVVEIDPTGGGAVDSVNGYTGVVVLDADDIGDGATNKAYTAAEQAKLAGVEAGATADQTGVEIKTAYEAEANTNAFTDAEKSKLGGVAAGAEVNVNPDWNAVSGDGQILNKPTIPSQAEAEAGTATTERVWTAQRVAQAIAALAPGGVDEIVYQTDCSGITNGFCIETGDGGLFYYNGSAVVEIDPAGGGPVDSVNGYTGVVVLDADDIGDGATNKAYTAAEQAKLAGVETGATADQTGVEIKTAYEAEANTNAFTDAEKSKLGAIEAGAAADQTGAEIKTAYEAEANTNAFTDAEKSKLGAIEAGATADQTGAEIKTAYEAEVNTNAFTDAEKSKLGGVAAGAEVNVNPDWNAVSGDGQILNKPTFTVSDLITLGMSFHFRSDSAVCDTGHVDHSTALATLSGYGIDTNHIACDTYPNIGISIAGVGMTASLGTLMVEEPLDVALIGLGLTAATGSVSVAVQGNNTVSLTGIGLAAATGSITVKQAHNFALTGIASTMGLGTLTVAVDAANEVTLTGLGLTAGVGTISAAVVSEQNGTYYATSNDNTIGKTGADTSSWSTVYRNATTANLQTVSNTTGQVVASHFEGSYYIYRHFIDIAIPAGSDVSAATLKFTADTVNAGGDVTVAKSTASIPPVAADFNNFGAEYTNSPVTVASSTQYSLTINAAGLAYLTNCAQRDEDCTSGVAKLVLMEDVYDYGNTDPSADPEGMDITVRTANYSGTASDPQIDITYTP